LKYYEGEISRLKLNLGEIMNKVMEADDPDLFEAVSNIIEV